jgi:hypothetical protein
MKEHIFVFQDFAYRLLSRFSLHSFCSMYVFLLVLHVYDVHDDLNIPKYS